MPLMTKEEFIAYANEALSGEALEPLYDTIAEHNGEVAAFGDSWPGALVRIHASITDVNRLERQLARLEGREPREFHFRVSSPR
jgi:endo-1,4-beta-mannosidase